MFGNSTEIVRLWNAQRPLHGLTDKFVDISFLLSKILQMIIIDL